MTWTLAVTVAQAGAATVSINKAYIDSGSVGITLFDGAGPVPTPTPTPTVTSTPQHDLSIKFGITSSETTIKQHVTDTFNAVNAYLATNPAVTATTTTTASATMPAGLAKNIGIIELGDYIDLVSLSIAADAGGGGVTLISPMDSTLLRLIVVGINSFNNINGNGTSPHLVFQFQNIPVNHPMNSSRTSVGGYALSEMRKYLVDVDGNGSGGNFLEGLKNAGVPDSVLWAPKRSVANGGGQGPNATVTAADILEDMLWLPTERELSGANTFSSAYESAGNQARFAYYTDSVSLEKSGGGYWMASPTTSVTYPLEFCSVLRATGYYYLYTQFADLVYGCVPAFCVK